MNEIFQRVKAEVAVSVTDLKRNPAKVVEMAQAQAVAILNHNRVVGYLIAPAVWEYAQELHDDAKIVERLEGLKEEEGIAVSLDEL
ncbi:MAG: antitoxin [Devosia sp.]